MSGGDPGSRDDRPPMRGGHNLCSIDDIARTMACGPCGDVVGPAEHGRKPGIVVVQAGTCPAHAEPNRPRWPGYDFNRFVELCQCCGTVPLRSGSRYATWFCAECREQVDLLNRRLGRYAIPIGRHSVHAGRLLSRENLQNPLEVEIFVSSMNAAFDAITVLSQWAQHVVRLNLRMIGEGEDSVVPIRHYCGSTRRHVDPFDRFREMCAWFEREPTAPPVTSRADPAAPPCR